MKSIYIGGEKMVLSVDGDVPFDLCKSQIRKASGSNSSPQKVIYFLKCEIKSICAHKLSPMYFSRRI